ncbi:hypothetical protein I4F81_011897 [Pyropia yezoensis]|uniref:Uncharacterized protein n=1 Tax=Pyropia yezoensis TaxID=2788 RepID=A0ACC3CI18_PYRYE|nr:hypothetical protein I4F81_011897 [Neopyropia yezoensis]
MHTRALHRAAAVPPRHPHSRAHTHARTHAQSARARPLPQREPRHPPPLAPTAGPAPRPWRRASCPWFPQTLPPGAVVASLASTASSLKRRGGSPRRPQRPVRRQAPGLGAFPPPPVPSSPGGWPSR